MQPALDVFFQHFHFSIGGRGFLSLSNQVLQGFFQLTCIKLIFRYQSNFKAWPLENIPGWPILYSKVPWFMAWLGLWLCISWTHPIILPVLLLSSNLAWLAILPVCSDQDIKCPALCNILIAWFDAELCVFFWLLWLDNKKNRVENRPLLKAIIINGWKLGSRKSSLCFSFHKTARAFNQVYFDLVLLPTFKLPA